ncbi:MAG: hypothetical protein HYX78_14260 [Armatimonadetes bacterium]|nr:hypothetical protein [Armatimonadota bacterium]
MKRLLVGLLLAVAVVLAVGYFAANRDQGADQEQILAVIERGRRAVERKSLSEAMSCISKDYSDSTGLNRDRLGLLARRAFQSSSRYEVVVDAPTIRVAGDEAVAETYAAVASVDAGTREEKFSGEVILSLRRENSRRFLIFPVREWKITAIEGIGEIADIDFQ